MSAENDPVAETEVLIKNTDRKLDCSNIISYGTADPEVLAEKTWLQFQTSFLASVLGGFSFGSITGWISPAIGQLDKEYQILESDYKVSLLGSLPFLGASLSILGPVELLLRKFRRKPTMLLLSLPLVLGWILMITAPNIYHLYVGRFLTGFAAGGFCITAPVFISEISDKDNRGGMSTLYPLLLTIGITFSFVIGGLISVQVLQISCVSIAVVFGIAFYFDKHDVPPRLPNSPSAVWEFDKRIVCKTLAIACGAMACQQLVGLQLIMAYFRIIFIGDFNQNYITYLIIFLGVVQIIGNLFGLSLVDKFGRKSLLNLSAIIMGVSLFIIAIYFYLDFHFRNLILIPCLITFTLGYCAGFGPVPWVLIGEVFPTKIKSVGASCAVFTNLIVTFITSYLFVPILSEIGRSGTFCLLALGSAISIVFVNLVVIETKGKTLQQIQNELLN